MSHHHQPVQVQMESRMFLLNKAESRTDVLERSGPSAASITDPAVFGVEGRNARRSQRFAQVSGVHEVVLRPPKTAMDVQQNGVRLLPARQTRFEKLIGVGAVCYTLIGWRLRLTENVFGGHRSAPRTNLALLQLQLALIFFNKSLKLGDGVEQPGPLLVVERHRKAAQSIHADATLLTHAELHGAASLFCLHLLFQIGKASFQFFVSWFCHGAPRTIIFYPFFLFIFVIIIGVPRGFRRGRLSEPASL